MGCIVFRFTHNKQQQQWVVPNEIVISNYQVSYGQITIPVQVFKDPVSHLFSEDVTFVSEERALQTIVGFDQNRTYSFYRPSTEPRDSVLNQIIKDWKDLGSARKVTLPKEPEENVYRP